MKKDGDPIKFLKDIFAEIEKETKEKTGDNAFLWAMHYNTWIDVIKNATNSISDKESGNSMLILRLLELQKTLLWIQLCALYGAYRPLIRELRFTLDSFLQSYYFEKNFPNDKIETKHEILLTEEKNLYGSNLIDKLDINYKTEIKELYHHLSKYQHSSYEELKPSIVDGKADERIIGGFDIELFDKCKELTNRVMDVVFYLVLNKYRLAIPKLKDDMTIYWLKELNSPLTLKLILDNS